MIEHWLWLAHRPGFSESEKLLGLLRRFGSVENLYKAGQEQYAAAGLSGRQMDALLDKALEPSQSILETCRRKNIRIFTFEDPGYPFRLRMIADAPLVLYCRGTMPGIDGLPAIGVVGTRNPSACGSSNARRLGAEISRCGGLVVSGLAKGVDLEAMTGALEAGFQTVGVVGCGVDVVYPSENASLYDWVEHQGCILSEFAPGTPPKRWHFPKRNRIISGLSVGTLVVEAPERSGSLITARHAKAQGRDVYVLSGNGEAPNSSGTQLLLQKGAAAVYSGWDTVRAYQQQFPDKLHREPTASDLPETGKSRQQEREFSAPELKKDIDNGQRAPYSDLKMTLADCSEQERLVVGRILCGTHRIDDLISECGLTPNQALRTLTSLQMRGIVTRQAGRSVSLTHGFGNSK